MLKYSTKQTAANSHKATTPPKQVAFHEASAAVRWENDRRGHDRNRGRSVPPQQAGIDSNKLLVLPQSRLEMPPKKPKECTRKWAFGTC